ncbi:MAG: ribosomal-processing cysteine protease Prp, partial [Leptospiraceae bacterium]|nr:ribosomal-processing cysteine protease Prp [Leptospiraceae bacterium]
LQIQHVGVITKVKVSGHSPSDMGKKGENLLCAGISVLAQSVFLYLWKQGRIQNFIRKDGLLEFEIAQTEKFEDAESLDSANVQAALQILILGVQDLQAQYPNEISIELGGKNGT